MEKDVIKNAGVMFTVSKEGVFSSAMAYSDNLYNYLIKKGHKIFVKYEEAKEYQNSINNTLTILKKFAVHLLDAPHIKAEKIAEDWYNKNK